ncbi:grasp-with-spasm system ATP-grasp peptide maturase [Chryseobacterium daecheongense]|uniref:grasp-with-spasm system ATP-grasp peptide maturase n=1 Tax=Chryseobacterium daecheongense TaxID=192389 RepID=UPI001FD63D5C|nr:grasp-with-spasm system ATP-grasp peptide maturase [Chryseobacterium daecheongense]UOU97263.1 grasp-with-spasm system ATP-grasp peptide maturase [Chryseobacterium daecheongense]
MFFVQTNTNDKSTNDVLDWIFYFDRKAFILRLNNEVAIKSFSYTISNKNKEEFLLQSVNDEIITDSYRQFWYRRGRFTFSAPQFTTQKLPIALCQKINNNLNKEQEYIHNVLNGLLSDNTKKTINTFQQNFTNKIKNLKFAVESGLQVPDSLVTNNFSRLLHFSSQYKSIITKDIEMDEIKISYDLNYKFIIGARVQMLTHQDILETKEKYQKELTTRYAFYQQYIEKKYELRIFYLKGKFYTMAIFSQANEKTKIDFRNYDMERPNRCIPYQLPKEIEDKLDLFMQSIDMNCGSIDMIYTPEGEYVFLEVNPIGQFQWVSRNCNYDIERQIALDLITEKI